MTQDNDVPAPTADDIDTRASDLAKQPGEFSRRAFIAGTAAAAAFAATTNRSSLLTVDPAAASAVSRSSALVSGPVRVVLIIADNMRYDDILHMPKTQGIFGSGTTTYLAHRAEKAACAPDRCALMTGLYSHNHRIGSGNTTAQYYQYCADGKKVGSGNSAVWVGPWESEAATPRLSNDDPQKTSGSLPNWLKSPGNSITTAMIGKYQNGYADSYQGNAGHLRVPPGWDFWRAITGDESATYNGGVDDEYNSRFCSGPTVPGVGTESIIHYKQKITSITVVQQGTIRIAELTLTPPSALETREIVAGDPVVVTGWAQFDADWNPNPGQYLAPPTISSYNSVTNQLRFITNAAVGTYTPPAAYAYPASLHQSLVLARMAGEFIDGRAADESFFLYLAPHEPATDDGNVDNRRREYKDTEVSGAFSKFGGVPMAVAPTTGPSITSIVNTGVSQLVSCAKPHGITSSTSVAFHGIAGMASRVPSGNTFVTATPTSDPLTLAVPLGTGLPTSTSATGAVVRRSHEELWQTRQELLISLDDIVDMTWSKIVERGWQAETIFVFTSDNGFMTGEHGVWDIGYTWEESIHLPLVVKNQPGAGGGGSISIPTSTIDLPMTMLDWFGLSNHYAHTKRDGISLARLAQWPNRHLLISNGPKAIISPGQYKLWYDQPGTPLYDLATDPIEATNIASINAATVAVLATKALILQNCSGDTCRT